ncbi:MAG: DNA-directed RNA polymerase sigma-70 factor [Planctomycetota bacterium]|nr:MAG: DNA-directed RNA polymerase sigma-70 factor [Planctomycetota bacterium]
MSVDPLATRLLQDHHADEAPLVELVWQELRERAGRIIGHERAGHTLQATALVNEAYLRLIDTTAVVERDRQRFLAIAARCMRRVLIDHARRRRATRRGGDEQRARVTLHPELLVGHDDIDLIDLSEALERFAALDPRASQVVELRFFGGLTVEETAEVLGVTDRTVRTDWRAARAWLHRELEGAGERPPPA